MCDKAVESQCNIPYGWAMKSDVTKMRMRATPEVGAMIFGAAKRSGVSVSKFVVQSAVERAVGILNGQEYPSSLAEMNAKFLAALHEVDRETRLEFQRRAAEDAQEPALPDANITSPPHAA
jgi:uncharacterized protein (DUF1778 family)